MHCNNGLNNKLVESLVENKVAEETGDLKYLQDSMYDFVKTLKEIILGEYSPEFFNEYVDEALKLHGSNLEEFLKIPKMGLELRQALNSIDDAIDTSNQDFRDNLVLLLDRFQTTLDNMEYQARDPYDTAVELGFTGTKQEWLEHLEGDSAYKIATLNGFGGTEAEWVNHLEGDSAYEIAVNNGYEGTQAEWLKYIRADGFIQSIQQFATNDSETKVQVPDYGTINSLQGYIKEMFEIGGLPATPFATKALMTASALVDGEYAQVTDDSVAADNGLYVKTTGAWVKSSYDPLTQSKDYAENSIAEFERSILDKSKNLFDLAASTNGFYIADDGNLIKDTSWAYSDYIPIKGQQGYYFDGFRSIAFYDSDKVFLSRQAISDKGEGKYYGNITMPHDAAFVRLSFRPAHVSYIGVGRQFSMGNSSVGYEPYYEPLLKDIGFSEDLQQKIREITIIEFSFFETDSVTNEFDGFDINSAVVELKIWGLPESEQLFLRTLYNAFSIGTGTLVASVGFNSSAGYHIAPDLALQNDFKTYAVWEISTPLSGVVTYFLYKNGDASNAKIGYVTVDWDKVPSTQIRFVNTANGAQVKSNVAHDFFTDYLEQKINSNSASSPFAGKRIGAIGDSITWGFRPRNDPDGASGGQLDSWLVLTANKLGMTYDNKGLSGSTLGANSTAAASPMSRRFNALANDCDIVVVMGGTNDVRKNVPLGTIDDRTDTTYYGALHVICEGLINKYQVNQGLEIGKTKHIVLATPTKLLESGSALHQNLQLYAQAVREVAEYYSLPVLDLNKYSNINPHILQTVQGTESGYMGVYNPYITDGTHPTQQGHEMMASYIAAFLKSFIA